MAAILFRGDELTLIQYYIRFVTNHSWKIYGNPALNIVVYRQHLRKLSTRRQIDDFPRLHCSE